jgi:hypothetical protein
MGWGSQELQGWSVKLTWEPMDCFIALWEFSREIMACGKYKPSQHGYTNLKKGLLCSWLLL